jgi:multiple antibiotic resistance protein
METAVSFLDLVFVGVVTLFPPVNPLGTALVVDPLLHGLDRSRRRSVAMRITFYCFLICLFSLLAGSWLFQLFGISLPVVQIAGGILICRMGWQLLSPANNIKEPDAAPAGSTQGAIDDILFYPLAFPMTTGAGTISVLLTLSAHGHADKLSAYITNLLALFIAIIIICIMIYFSYAYTPALKKRLGHRGEQIANRLSAFLVFCVGLQIALSGLGHFLWG